MERNRETATFDTRLPLDSGASLDGFEITYETYGKLSAARDNAILLCHALTGSARAAGAPEGDQPAGWWDAAIGPGEAFDTDRFFVVCSNVLGGCAGSTGPGSDDPASGRPFGLRFPFVTIGDMVSAQALLADHLEIDRLHTVAGGCMGGLQVLEWMARFPERLRNGVVISATPRTSTHTIGLWHVIRETLMRDPDFRGGDYYDAGPPLLGQRLIAMFGLMVWMSPTVMSERFGRRLVDAKRPRFTLEPEFEVEALLRRVGDNAGNRFDANSLIYLTKAMDHFDLTRDGGDLAEVFAGFAGRALLLSYDSDWRYPPAKVDEIRVALERAGTEVEHRVLHSDYGHGAFMYDPEGAGAAIAELLATGSTPGA